MKYPGQYGDAPRLLTAKNFERLHQKFRPVLNRPIASKDVAGNKISSQAKLAMPALTIIGEKSFDTNRAGVMRNAATNVQEAVVPQAGHWRLEENPEAVIALITTFLGSGR
jgi:pimeloyl-ACP methyl ester carboxylesterase